MSRLPHWNLDSIYLGLDSREFTDDLASMEVLVATLEQRLANENADTGVWLGEVLVSYQELLDLTETLFAYTSALLTVDTNDAKAMLAVNKVESSSLAVKGVHVKLLNALSRREDAIRAVLESDGPLSRYRFVIKELMGEQEHTMSEAEEALAADLNRSGADAWGRLQEAVSSNADYLWDEATGEHKTVIQLRALAFEKDRAVRERAFKAELSVWKRHEIAFAYALNGVKGTSLTLDKRRGYRDSLHRAVEQARITDEVLCVLIETIEKNLEVFRTYLRAKAHALGRKRLAFFDLFAPVGELDMRYSHEEARSFIIENFKRFHPPLGEFATMAFDEQWIDSEPRAGKVGGAYCTSFPLRGETRILANFDHSFDGMSTLAHELGHAYHDHVTKDLPALLRHYPMTLAETASIFSQFIIFQGALKDAPPESQVALIESFLQDATQTCVDILSRFYFERDVFARRAEGELMADQYSLLMQEAQKAAYGDALDKDSLHPYMWAVKGHYYSNEVPFYNFPYAFGQLFGLGVYRLSEEDPETFGARYDELLVRTGQHAAPTVTASIGCDITTGEFWQQSIDVIATYVKRFCELTGYEREREDGFDTRY